MRFNHKSRSNALHYAEERFRQERIEEQEALLAKENKDKVLAVKKSENQLHITESSL